jgi:hypothetical protein
MPTLRLFTGVLLAGLTLCTAGRAAVVTNSTTLPPLGVGFSIGGGGSCFSAVGVCAVPGILTFTSIASSSFNLRGQDIVANATLTADVTMLSTVTPVLLTGTVEEEVIGRTATTQTGSWPTQLLSFDLGGPVVIGTLSGTLDLGLDTSHTSTGGASVDDAPGQDGLFSVDSFFDVFVELTFDQGLPGIPPLSTTRGPFVVSLAPEPATLVLLAGPILGLAVLRRNRRTH